MIFGILLIVLELYLCLVNARIMLQNILKTIENSQVELVYSSNQKLNVIHYKLWKCKHLHY